MMTETCVFCNGDVEPNAEGIAECVLCGTTFKKCTDERARELSRQNEIKELQKLSKEIWGR